MRFHKFIPLLMFAAGFLVYSNTITHQYVLDDVLVITGNKFTQKGIKGIPEIFTTDLFIGAYGEALSLSGGRYRPLSIASFAIEYEIYGQNPSASHLINVLLFAITCVLVYFFLRKLLTGFNEWIPAVAALLFAVHPIHTEVVANIKSRDEILAVFFLLLSLMQLLNNNRNAWLLSAVYYFLALMSKENSITALAIFPLTIFLCRHKTLRQSLMAAIPYLITAVIYIALRAKFAGMVGDRDTSDILDNPFVNASPAEKLATVILISGLYVKLLLMPWPLSYDYSYNEIPLTSFTDWRVWLILLLISGLIIFSIKVIWIRMKNPNTIHSGEPQQKIVPVSITRTWQPKLKSAQVKLKKDNQGVRQQFGTGMIKLSAILSYGILFYVIAYSIVSNFVFNIGTNMGERFAYMPSLGFCIAVTALIAKITGVELTGAMRVRFLWILALILIAVPFAAMTAKRNQIWRSNYSLYSSDVKAAPNSARTHLYYGIELIGKYEKDKNPATIQNAITEINRSCHIAPSFHHAWYNLGIAWQSIDRHDSAIAAFNQVLKLQPTHIKSHYCLGVSYGKGKGDMDKAIYYLEKAMNFNYRDVVVYDNLGIAYAMKGNFEKAVEVFNEGISKFPQNGKLYLNLATTYANKGDKETADKYFSRAFELEPALKGSVNQ